MDLFDYGLPKNLLPVNTDKIPARVSAVHKQRYELICEYGEIFGKLKAGVYYRSGKKQVFPAVGDFVLLDYNTSGDSHIVATLPRKTLFSRRDQHQGRASKLSRQTLTTFLLYSRLTGTLI